MLQQTEIYRSIRTASPRLPAYIAWDQARRRSAVEQWAEAVGFEWQDDWLAIWFESGFHMQAIIDNDEAGWDMLGVDDLGRFTCRWEPGAIEHDRFNNRICDWFVPVDADCGRELYRRACRFGDDWTYVVIDVTASRDGIQLGSTSLCGIESDSGEAYLTDVAFDLADEAIEDANRSLKTLCASQPACV